MAAIGPTSSGSVSLRGLEIPVFGASCEEPLREGRAGRNPREERLPSDRADASLPRGGLSTFSSRRWLELGYPRVIGGVAIAGFKNDTIDDGGKRVGKAPPAGGGFDERRRVVYLGCVRCRSLRAGVGFCRRMLHVFPAGRGHRRGSGGHLRCPCGCRLPRHRGRGRSHSEQPHDGDGRSARHHYPQGATPR
jgi:hypothetical protein